MKRYLKPISTPSHVWKFQATHLNGYLLDAYIRDDGKYLFACLDKTRQAVFYRKDNCWLNADAICTGQKKKCAEWVDTYNK